MLGYCGSPQLSGFVEIESCSDLIKDSFNTDFTANCKGQYNCSSNSFLLDYLDKTDARYADCSAIGARFYVQYFCEQPISDINSKRQLALFIVCLGFFICFIYFLMIYYLSKTSTLDYKLWDVLTVTSADFTVEYFIPEIVWTQFCELPEAKQDGTKATAFESYLKKYFEELI